VKKGDGRGVELEGVGGNEEVIGVERDGEGEGGRGRLTTISINLHNL